MEKDQAKTTEGIIKILKEIDSVLTKNVGIVRDIIWILQKFFSILVSIIFILNFLIWKIFLWEPVKKLFNLIFNFNNFWTKLSEPYKILILGATGAIISGIIAHIIGGLILDKIRELKEKNPK